ncbi:nucleotidyltransferase family protein [Paenibacillus humicola]|uniref:nucleotidyltransferase domain-containing protein n=1 Tax=Paenibacillus humicola TaxID=3110540 RepID=UPI00237A5E5A|nr:nucleotidyltransferase family protein [Paenibacillus humicola]
MSSEISLDMGSFPNELKLLLALIGLDNDSESFSHVRKDINNIDWGKFLQLTRHHRVFPLVAKNINKIDKKIIPIEIAKSIYSDFRKNTLQMLHLSAEMERICESFKNNNICLIVLKGPVLAKALYGDVSFRTSKDLDILVPTEKIEMAGLLLQELGYKTEVNNTSFKQKGNHISYINSEKCIEIELHWKLNPGDRNEPEFKELWERKRLSPLSISSSIYLLGNEDLFLFLILHGARHGWFRLRWLVDIDFMIRNGIDWSIGLPLLKKYNCLTVVGQAIILASQLFKTAIPNDLEGLTKNKLSLNLAKKALIFIKDMIVFTDLPKKLVPFFKYYSFLLLPSSKRWMFLLNLLYPNIRDVQILTLPKPLHFLYFPLRPLLWFWRLSKSRSSISAKKDRQKRASVG